MSSESNDKQRAQHSQHVPLTAGTREPPESAWTPWQPPFADVIFVDDLPENDTVEAALHEYFENCPGFRSARRVRRNSRQGVVEFDSHRHVLAALSNVGSNILIGDTVLRLSSKGSPRAHERSSLLYVYLKNDLDTEKYFAPSYDDVEAAFCKRGGFWRIDSHPCDSFLLVVFDNHENAKMALDDIVNEHGAMAHHVTWYEFNVRKVPHDCIVLLLPIPVDCTAQDLAAQVKHIAGTDFLRVMPSWKSSFSRLVIFDDCESAKKLLDAHQGVMMLEGNEDIIGVTRHSTSDPWSNAFKLFKAYHDETRGASKTLRVKMEDSNDECLRSAIVVFRRMAVVDLCANLEWAVREVLWEAFDRYVSPMLKDPARHLEEKVHACPQFDFKLADVMVKRAKGESKNTSATVLCGQAANISEDLLGFAVQQLRNDGRLMSVPPVISKLERPFSAYFGRDLWEKLGVSCAESSLLLFRLGDASDQREVAVHLTPRSVEMLSNLLYAFRCCLAHGHSKPTLYNTLKKVPTVKEEIVNLFKPCRFQPSPTVAVADWILGMCDKLHPEQEPPVQDEDEDEVEADVHRYPALRKDVHLSHGDVINMQRIALVIAKHLTACLSEIVVDS